jgi:hypothetical protein
MIKVPSDKLSSIPEPVRILIGILVFGSIWGLLEATLGGVMHLINFPNTGAIMGGVGMIIMATALAYYRKPAMLTGIGVVAASFKLLNVWLLLIPVNVPHIINPIAAIILEAMAFSLVAIFLVKGMEKSNYTSVWAAVLAGILSASAFALVAVYITHIPVNTRSGLDSVREFVTVNGLVQAVFAGVLAPAGYIFGRKLAAITPLVLKRRSIYFTASASTVLLCWGFGALAIIAGL